MMIRPFTLLCALLSGITGMVLYTQKHKTTVLDHQIAKIVANTQTIQSRTTMMQTEWALLNQPDRLKNLSTHFLPQLHPVQPYQFVQMSSLVQQLPAPQKEPLKDKTRDHISAVVAANHEQHHNPQLPDNVPVNDTTKQIAESHKVQETPNNQEPMPKKEILSGKPAVTDKTASNLIAASTHNPVTTQKQKNTEQATIHPIIKTKKPQKIDMAENDDAVISKSTHTNNIASTRNNVTRNDPSNRIKTTSDRRKVTPKDDDLTDMESDITRSLVRHSSPKTVQNHKIRDMATPSLQATRNSTINSTQKVKYVASTTKRHTESALDNGSSESLPAPVPFSQ